MCLGTHTHKYTYIVRADIHALYHDNIFATYNKQRNLFCGWTFSSTDKEKT